MLVMPFLGWLEPFPALLVLPYLEYDKELTIYLAKITMQLLI